MLAFVFVVPLIYAAVGYFMKKRHSKYPSTVSGFHVGYIADLNEDTWEDANTYAGGVLIRAGLWELAAGAVLCVSYAFLRFPHDFAVFFCYFLCAAFLPFVLLMALTQRHLEKNL